MGELDVKELNSFSHFVPVPPPLPPPYILLDLRDRDDYEQAHIITGTAISAPPCCCLSLLPPLPPFFPPLPLSLPSSFNLPLLCLLFIHRSLPFPSISPSPSPSFPPAKHYPPAMLNRSCNFFTKEILEYVKFLARTYMYHTDYLFFLDSFYQKNQPGKIIILYDEDERIVPQVAATFVQREVENVFMLSGGQHHKKGGRGSYIRTYCNSHGSVCQSLLATSTPVTPGYVSLN